MYIIQLFLVLIVHGQTSNHLQCAQSLVCIQIYLDTGDSKSIRDARKAIFAEFLTMHNERVNSEYTSRRQEIYLFNNKFYLPRILIKKIQIIYEYTSISNE